MENLVPAEHDASSAILIDDNDSLHATDEEQDTPAVAATASEANVSVTGGEFNVTARDNATVIWHSVAPPQPQKKRRKKATTTHTVDSAEQEPKRSRVGRIVKQRRHCESILLPLYRSSTDRSY